jgi:hypothetical protein
MRNLKARLAITVSATALMIECDLSNAALN